MNEQQIFLGKAITDLVNEVMKVADKIRKHFEALTILYSNPKNINSIKYKSHKNITYKLNSQVIDRKPSCIRCRNYC